MPCEEQTRCLRLRDSRVGENQSTRQLPLLRKRPDCSLSIFVIGMRGAGKTTTGRLIASVLSRVFLDLDHDLAARNGIACSEIVRLRGWEAFRQEELGVLSESMQTRRTGFVISCGGGIVETPEARQLLRQWPGLVVQVSRDTEAVVDYLTVDKTRHAYTEQIQQVYERRKPFLEELSDALYLSTQKQLEGRARAAPPQDLLCFLDRLYGPDCEDRAEQLLSKSQLQVRDVSAACQQQSTQDDPRQNGAGVTIDLADNCDALYLRATQDECADLDSLAVRIARLRCNTLLPLVLSLEITRSPLPDLVLKQVCRLADRMRVEAVALPSSIEEHYENVLQSICYFTRLVFLQDE
ncbi:shikimate kinase-domain-containing protein [Microdochium trichocladiopsis]|uniref:shikimate kinase n=1 Tax=Microdochium trichocladiopsis TaxID=1682393 RepID=A0A9P8YD83_9PEZI|nr:shikimate kinase-domain-containing protein [Microdochium trichocladiopsis]KAH7035780.1 shikimate kinase-domain-containing protein [Microdochium trichocladiopsis]